MLYEVITAEHPEYHEKVSLVMIVVPSRDRITSYNVCYTKLLRRIDLDYLVFRIDGGMKALNPAYSSGKQRYPILNPNFKRDFTFHLAVGYPF